MHVRKIIASSPLRFPFDYLPEEWALLRHCADQLPLDIQPLDTNRKRQYEAAIAELLEELIPGLNSVRNVEVLLDRQHLMKTLPQRHWKPSFSLENHLAVVQLFSLRALLAEAWNRLPATLHDDVIYMCQVQTLENLGSDATCFTHALRYFIMWLCQLEPELNEVLDPVGEKRRQFYRNR